MSKEFGEKIREIRKKNGLTQTDLAFALGYSDKSMIAHIENGDNEMSNDKISLLIEKYNIDANELFKKKENLLDNISKEQKIYELSLIWREAKYNFAFWNKFDSNFDWDNEYKCALSRVLKTNNLYDYYLELKRFLALLKDGHTGVRFPESIYDSKEYGAKLPISIEYINGEYVINNVKSVAKDSIKRFSVIKKINGIDINDYIKDNIYPYMWHEKEDSASGLVIDFLRNGPLGSTIKLQLSFDGRDYEVEVIRTKGDIDWVFEDTPLKLEEMKQVFSSKTHSIYFTSDRIAVINLDSFGNDEFKEEIFKNYDLLKEAKAYIIDIRENDGGNSTNSDYLASLFIGERFVNGNDYYPAYIGAYKAWGKSLGFVNMPYEEFKKKYNGNVWYEKMYKICNNCYYEHSQEFTDIEGLPGVLKGPIVILISHKTASAAEDFVNVMKSYTDSIFIGSSTFGSTGQPLTIELNSGGSFRICADKCLSLNNKEFINTGFKPDVECYLTIKDIINGNDSVMKRAIYEMRKAKRI